MTTAEWLGLALVVIQAVLAYLQSRTVSKLDQQNKQLLATYTLMKGE